MESNKNELHSLASHSAAIPVYAGHVPGLVAHLDVPERTLLPVEAVPGPLLLDELPGLWVLDPGALPQPLAFSFPALHLACRSSLREGAGGPRSHPEAVHALWTRARPRCTRLELSEVGANRAPKQRRDQDAPHPVPEARSTRFGAGRPRRVLGEHAILRARDRSGRLFTYFPCHIGLSTLSEKYIFFYIPAQQYNYILFYIVQLTPPGGYQ